jgi:hypothetical protein
MEKKKQNKKTDGRAKEGGNDYKQETDREKRNDRQQREHGKGRVEGGYIYIYIYIYIRSFVGGVFMGESSRPLWQWGTISRVTKPGEEDGKEVYPRKREAVDRLKFILYNRFIGALTWGSKSTCKRIRNNLGKGYCVKTSLAFSSLLTLPPSVIGGHPHH